MRNINEILDQLALASRHSKEHTRRFHFLKKMIAAGDYQEALAHINKMVNKNADSDYVKLLLELKQHVDPTLAPNIKERFANLLHAILAKENRLQLVQQALDTGSAIVADTEYSITALKLAIHQKDEAVIRLLMNYGATLDNINVDLPLNDQNESILQIACRLKLYDLIVMALAKGANPNLADVNGTTALHIACEMNDDDIAILLLNKKANPAAVNTNGKTPFSLAIDRKNQSILTAMLMKEYELTDDDLLQAKNVDSDIHQFLKKPFIARRNEIMQRGKFGLFPEERHSLQSLFNRIYVENVQLQADIIRRLEMIYGNQNPIMKPLLDLVLLAAEGKHDAGIQSGKKLKIIMTHHENINDLTAESQGAKGIYNASNTAYVAGFHGDKRKSLSSMLHELKHFADAQIFGASNPPYYPQHEAHFNAVKKKLNENSEHFMANKLQDAKPEDVLIYQSIHAVFTDYDAKEQDDEILVKVPEIIGLLGVNKGYKWLEEHEAGLLKYYEFRFNPVCVRYLDERKVMQAAKQKPPTI